jgi:hypothetical protein
VFHQPAMPLPEETRSAPKRKFAKAPTPPPPKPSPGPAPGQDEHNKGNQLLKKMGWIEGTGLGLEGEGRQAPVQTFLFAEKAGIGASKPKDTTNFTGFESYGQKAKDSVCCTTDRDALKLTTTKPRRSTDIVRPNETVYAAYMKNDPVSRSIIPLRPAREREREKHPLPAFAGSRKKPSVSTKPLSDNHVVIGTVKGIISDFLCCSCDPAIFIKGSPRLVWFVLE